MEALESPRCVLRRPLIDMALIAEYTGQNNQALARIGGMLESGELESDGDLRGMISLILPEQADKSDRVPAIRQLLEGILSAKQSEPEPDISDTLDPVMVRQLVLKVLIDGCDKSERAFHEFRQSLLDNKIFMAAFINSLVVPDPEISLDARTDKLLGTLELRMSEKWDLTLLCAFLEQAVQAHPNTSYLFDEPEDSV